MELQKTRQSTLRLSFYSSSLNIPCILHALVCFKLQNTFNERLRRKQRGIGFITRQR
jgi:hypothetical protein